MIYSDGIHVVADTIKELHQWAAEHGIKRCWYHHKKSMPHYDFPGHMRQIGKFKSSFEKDMHLKLVETKEIVILAQQMVKNGQYKH